MNRLKAVILAAGKGERLGALTKTIPKPMISIEGKPILEHMIMTCRAGGIDDIYINLHHLPNVIQSYFGDGSRWGVHITYKYEPVILGTSGGVKNFESELGAAPFFVLYGDNVIAFDLKKTAETHHRQEADMSLVVFKKEDVRPSGQVHIDTHGFVTSFIEKPQGDKPLAGFANAGIYFLEPNLLRYIPAGYSDFGKDIIPLYIRKGLKVLAIKNDQPVKAVDTPELYRQWCHGSR